MASGRETAGTEQRGETGAAALVQQAEASLGERLRWLRAAAGLTQDELAERSGVSARSISNLERGLPHAPRRDTISRLADALDLAPGERAALLAAVRRSRASGQLPAAAPLNASTGNNDRPGPVMAAAPIPVPPTSLIGRDEEIASVSALLRRPNIRLVTLIGPAGVGKTRLALAVAPAMGADFEDGVQFVALAAVRDPASVISTITRTLGLREDGGRSLLEILVEWLRDRCFLLVLDNFEQVTQAAPDLADLLLACRRLTLLVTSRAPLRLRGEHEWTVRPLALPNLAEYPATEQLARSAAVALFVERAEAVRRDFILDETSVATVASICARLDGLPLAIELAAPWMRLLSPAALLKRLTSRLAALVGGARDLPARQQTLRGAIGWSYDLLDPAQQRLFRSLAVFPASAELTAIEAICTVNGFPDSPGLVLAGLRALCEQSLLRQETTTDGGSRFTMLETVREYAAELLAGHGEWAEARRRHAQFFLLLAEEAEARLRGPEQGGWVARLTWELDNLRAALTWSLEADDAELGLRLATSLGHFWRMRGYLAEGQRWLEEMLVRADNVPEAVRAKALNAAGAIASDRHDLTQAAAWYGTSLAIWRRLGDTRRIATSLIGLGGVAFRQNQYEAAENYYRQSLAQARAAGHTWETAGSLNNLALTLRYRGQPADAAPFALEGLALFRKLSDRQAAARALSNLGEITLVSGDHAAAQPLLEEALAIERELGDRSGVAGVLVNLAQIARDQGEYERAMAYSRESLTLAREAGRPNYVAECLELAGGVARRQGDALQAARLLGGVSAWRESRAAPRHEVDQAAFDHEVECLRTALGEPAFTLAWEAGRALSLDQLIAGWPPLAGRPLPEQHHVRPGPTRPVS